MHRGVHVFGIKTLSTNSCNWGHAHFMMTGDNLHDERFCAICFYFVEQHQLFNLTFYYQCTRGRPGNGLMVFYLDKAAISIQCGFFNIALGGHVSHEFSHRLFVFTMDTTHNGYSSGHWPQFVLLQQHYWPSNCNYHSLLPLVYITILVFQFVLFPFHPSNSF